MVIAIIAIAAYKLARSTNKKDPLLWTIFVLLTAVTVWAQAELAEDVAVGGGQAREPEQRDALARAGRGDHQGQHGLRCSCSGRPALLVIAGVVGPSAGSTVASADQAAAAAPEAADLPQPSLPRELFLANAPSALDGLLLVPGVMGSGDA